MRRREGKKKRAGGECAHSEDLSGDVGNPVFLQLVPLCVLH